MSAPKSTISRRKFIIGTMVAAPALATVQMVSGNTQPAAAASTAANQEYSPTFFTKEEFAFVTAATARLIPADKLGPGAVEAGVPEFIDKQMNTPYAVGSNWYMQGPFHPDADPAFGYQLPLLPKDVYRLGIAEADAAAQKNMAKFSVN